MDGAVVANMFATNPTISIQISISPDMVMLPFMIMVMIHRHMEVKIIGTTTYGISISGGKRDNSQCKHNRYQ
jgi:hypothetical protein